MKVPVQIHHGTADQSVAMSETQKTEKLLKAQGTPVEVFLYEGADHGFLAYTRPFYKPGLAKLAWTRHTVLAQVCKVESFACVPRRTIAYSGRAITLSLTIKCSGQPLNRNVRHARQTCLV